MKGKNELTLNQTTMRDAIQEYLCKRLPATPVQVTGVKEVVQHLRAEPEEASFVVAFQSVPALAETPTAAPA